MLWQATSWTTSGGRGYSALYCRLICLYRHTLQDPPRNSLHDSFHDSPMYSTSESTAPTSRDARTPASRAQVHIPYHLSEARNNVACGPIDSNTVAAARVPTIPLRHTTASRWQASCRKALAESCCCRCVPLMLQIGGAALVAGSACCLLAGCG